MNYARRATQISFLLLSLGVFFGWIADRRVISFYHALHLWPTAASLPWFSLAPLGSFAMWVAAGLLLVTLGVGRIYCGFLCPVGFIQETAAKFGGWIGVRPRSVAGWIWARWFLLAALLTATALRSSAYHYFDHFSNLGRVYGLANSLRAGGPFGWSFILGVAFLLALVLASLRWPRWFCGTLCPSGAAFMLLRRAALAKVRTGSCAGTCGLCARVCPAACIESGRIDEELCVDCMECLRVCAKNELSFGLRRARKAAAFGGLSRRGFLAAGAAVLTGSAFGAGIRRALRAGPAAAVVPPGGKSYASFLERCAACGACASVCPTKVLVPAGGELGRTGLAKMRLDFSAGYCAYECNACLAVCPSGAISYFPLDAKKRIRIGMSHLHRRLCVAYALGQDCGACQEVCPTGAIVMERRGSTRVPVLRGQFCIGCGACQFACPTQPRKAMEVMPLETQSIAYAPAAAAHQHLAETDTSGFPF